MIIGEKNIFAIEIENDSTYPYKGYAKVLLYVNNIPIGYFNDVTYLSSFFASLENEFIDFLVPKLQLRDAYITLISPKLLNFQ